MLKWFRQEAPRTVAQAGDIAIANPWARLGTRTPGIVGGYFTVTNRGSEPDRLLSASSPAAESVQIHAVRVVGAGIRVRPQPDGLAILPGSSLELKPRGYHLQLSGLRRAITVGDQLPVILAFAKGGNVELTLRIEDRGLVGSDVLDEEAHRGG